MLGMSRRYNAHWLVLIAAALSLPFFLCVYWWRRWRGKE